MRPLVLGLFLTLAVLLPITGNAQVNPFRTPPEVTAAAADWQVNSEPVLVGGLVYYPTRGFRFFDGQVMVQIGVFDGVPVFTDATIEPDNVMYVPVGRNRMREYERRRDGALAGTTGSRAPSFPVQSPSFQALRGRPAGAAGADAPIEAAPRVATMRTEVDFEPAPEPSSAGSIGTMDSPTPAPVGTGGRARSARPRARATSTPSSVANGIWLEFDGVRWYSGGPSASFSADRFEPAGEYRGFPVFRDKTNRAAIWVQTVNDGPLAPYVRR